MRTKMIIILYIFTMNFRDFYKADDINFCINAIEVSVKEIPMLHHERIMLEEADAELINFIKSTLQTFANKTLAVLRTKQFPKPKDYPEEKLKKYKVSLRYPRTSSGKKLGHYLPDNMYVFAKDANDAKARAEEFIRNKYEPIENDERRHRKINFLKDLEKKHLDMKTKEVRSWDDLVQMFGDIGKKSGAYLLDYFDERDLQTILKKAKKKDFEKELAKLDKVQQRILKKVYFILTQDPYISDDTKKLIDGETTVTINKLGRSIKPSVTEREPGTEDEVDWPYWSIFEPKSDKEETDLRGNMNSVNDVFMAARRYGIPAKDLRYMAADEVDKDYKDFNNKKELYNYIIGIMKNAVAKKISNTVDEKGKRYYKKLFREIFTTDKYDDWNNSVLPKLGIHWDQIVKSLASGEYDAWPFARQSDDSIRNEGERPEEWLWKFIKDKPRVQPLYMYYQDALNKLLARRDEIKTTSDVPF
jgi:hypothetical protein